MTRGDLTDNQWERLEPHLPPRKPKRGRPNADHRRIINGILWIDRTGAPWRDLPEKLRSVEDGCQPLLPLAEGWGVGSHTKGAPEPNRPTRRARLGGALPGCDHREGSSACRRGKRGDPKSEALGYSQGGFSTKVHIERKGWESRWSSSNEGQRNEMVGFLAPHGEWEGQGRAGDVRGYAPGASAPRRATPRGWFDAICGVGA